MMYRCYNPKSPKFSIYGARGIEVWADWHDREAFFDFMGPRPEATTVDRIDPDWHYEPGNVKWATQAEQQRNRRNNVMNPDTVNLIRFLHANGLGPAAIERYFDKQYKYATIYDVVKNRRWVP